MTCNHALANHAQVHDDCACYQQHTRQCIHASGSVLLDVPCSPTMVTIGPVRCRLQPIWALDVCCMLILTSNHASCLWLWRGIRRRAYCVGCPTRFLILYDVFHSDLLACVRVELNA